MVITQTGNGPNFTWTVSDLALGAGGIITLTGVLTTNVKVRKNQFLRAGHCASNLSLRLC